MRKFRFLISTVVLSVLGLFLASCSIGGNAQYMKLYKYVESFGTEYELYFDSSNNYYSAEIPLIDIADLQQVLIPGCTVNINYQLLTVDELKNFGFCIVSSNSQLSYQKIGCYEVLPPNFVTMNNCSIEITSFITNQTPQLSDYKIRFFTNLRDGETSVVHADKINIKLLLDITSFDYNEVINMQVDTVKAGTDTSKYTNSFSSNEIFAYEFVAGNTYYAEWIDSYNAHSDSYWGNTVVIPDDWTLFDNYLVIIDSNFKQVLNTDDLKEVPFNCPSTGTYYVKCLARSETGGAFHVYK